MILTLLLACSPEPLDVSASLGDVGTVVIVELRDAPDDATSGTVNWTADYGGEGQSQLDFSVQPPRALVVGLKPDADVTIEVDAVVAGAVASSEPLEVTTGSVPTWLPSVTVEVDDGDQHLGGDVILTSVVTSPAAAVMIDADGDYVWWAELDGAHQVGRVRKALDGTGIYALPVNIAGESERGLIFVPWEGGEQTDTDLPGAHHDFVELEDGTIGFLTTEERTVEGELLEGDLIEERAPDGSIAVVWSAFDSIDATATPSGLDEPGDWSHGNVIVYDPAEDDWLVSLLGVRGIARVDRGSGGLDWLLGSEVGDFQDSSGETNLLDRQHTFELTDDGIVLFENGLPDTAASRAVEFSLDTDRWLAEEVWAYEPDPAMYTFSLGAVDRLDNGDTLVTFSIQGRIDEVDTAGNLRWRLSAGLGGTFGYSEVISLP